VALPSSNPELSRLGAGKYVLLTTFRTSGKGVGTPVWVGAAGDALLVTTGRDLGKVKRIRNDPRVQLVACDARGNVKDGAPVLDARAEVLDDDASRAVLAAIFEKKYGLQFRAMRVAAKLRGHSNGSVVLRLTDA
jgi:PPOX class probable F420-dependent enzyme